MTFFGPGDRWEKYRNNPNFEFSPYSDRLNIDDPYRNDLVTREGLPASIKCIHKTHAYGFIDGEDASWYYKKTEDGHKFLRQADSPHVDDVMVPKDRGMHDNCDAEYCLCRENINYDPLQAALNENHNPHYCEWLTTENPKSITGRENYRDTDEWIMSIWSNPWMRVHALEIFNAGFEAGRDRGFLEMMASLKLPCDVTVHNGGFAKGVKADAPIRCLLRHFEYQNKSKGKEG